MSFETVVSALVGALIATVVAEFIKSYVRRNQRKEAERDQALADMETTSELLLKLGVEYWSHSANDLADKGGNIRPQIVGLQHYLTSRVAEFVTGKEKQDCDVELTKYFDALTGGDFDNPERARSEHRLTQLHLSAHTVKHVLKQKRSRMPKPWFG